MIQVPERKMMKVEASAFATELLQNEMAMTTTTTTSGTSSGVGSDGGDDDAGRLFSRRVRDAATEEEPLMPGREESAKG